MDSSQSLLDSSLIIFLQSSNKKSANANCSLEMIAKLIEMSLIGTKADEQNTQKQNSQKRKVDDVGIDLI